MYQCFKKLVTYKDYSCFDHFYFPAHSDIQCLHLMCAEVAWVLVSEDTQVQQQIILNPDYLPDYPSVFFDYVLTDSSLGLSSFLKNEQRNHEIVSEPLSISAQNTFLKWHKINWWTINMDNT